MTKGQETRLKIIRCAIHEFGSFGLHLATLDKIAKKAKVPRPLILHYFKNKSQLLKEAIEQVLVEFSGLTASASNPDSSGLEKVHSILNSNLLLAKKYPDSTRLIIMLYSGATWDQEFSELYLRVTQSARGRYATALKAAARERQIKEDQDFDSIATAIHYWIIGAMMDFLQSGSTAAGEKKVRANWENWTKVLLSPVH